MTVKIKTLALLLAQYDASKDEAMYLLGDLNRAEQRRDSLRRQLVELIGEQELANILEEEPSV